VQHKGERRSKRDPDGSRGERKYSGGREERKDFLLLPFEGGLNDNDISLHMSSAAVLTFVQEEERELRVATLL
jgi:hypothetical protein